MLVPRRNDDDVGLLVNQIAEPLLDGLTWIWVQIWSPEDKP